MDTLAECKALVTDVRNQLARLEKGLAAEADLRARRRAKLAPETLERLARALLLLAEDAGQAADLATDRGAADWTTS